MQANKKLSRTREKRGALKSSHLAKQSRTRFVENERSAKNKQKNEQAFIGENFERKITESQEVTVDKIHVTLACVLVLR